MTVCASNHPPKPIYDVSNFQTLLEDKISCLLDNDPDSIVILTGDLNRLNTVELQLQQGLEQIVNLPTHNKNSLDQFITNRSDLFKSSLCLSHSLNHLFPDKRRHTQLMSLRPRGHDFSLPQLKYRLSRCSFANRSLFTFV